MVDLGADPIDGDPIIGQVRPGSEPPQLDQCVASRSPQIAIPDSSLPYSRVLRRTLSARMSGRPLEFLLALDVIQEHPHRQGQATLPLVA